MFEIINSQQEALHHNYEMYSVIPQTLLQAGKSPIFFREVEVKQERFEKDAPNTFTENKSTSKHRYAIYQVHHLKNKTKIMQLWIGQRSCEFSSIVSIISQNYNLEAVHYSAKHNFTLPVNKQVSNNLISVIRFNMGNRASQSIGHVKNTKKLTLKELFWQKVKEQIDLFTDTAAILN